MSGDYDYRVEFKDTIGEFFQFKENVRAYVIARGNEYTRPETLDCILDHEGSLDLIGGAIISVVEIEPGTLDYVDGSDAKPGGSQFMEFMESHGYSWIDKPGWAKLKKEEK